MMNNMNDFMNFYQQMRQNPMQVLSRKYNIPQSLNMSNPNDIIQYLLNTGQVTQGQVNNVMGMRNNPIIQQLFNKRY